MTVLPEQDYKVVNAALWNAKTAPHVTSDFYDTPGFLAGAQSLKSIELELLGDVRGSASFICNVTLVKTPSR